MLRLVNRRWYKALRLYKGCLCAHQLPAFTLCARIGIRSRIPLIVMNTSVSLRLPLLQRQIDKTYLHMLDNFRMKWATGEERTSQSCLLFTAASFHSLGMLVRFIMCRLWIGSSYASLTNPLFHFFFLPIPLLFLSLSLSLSLNVPPLQTVCRDFRSRKIRTGENKIESEMVGVLDKIGWQRWVDKRGMDKWTQEKKNPTNLILAGC